jgi:sensor histidine kinase YesM
MAEKVKLENILLDFLVSKKWRIARHAAMVVVLAAVFYPNIDIEVFKKLKIENPGEIIKGIENGTIAMYFSSIVLLYVNLLVFIPRWLLKNKYALYFIACILLAFVNFISEYFISRFFLQSISKYATVVEFSIKGFIDSSFIPLIFLGATAGHQIFKKWVIDTRLLAEMKEAKIQEELTNLKNQINPHFLFNTLNNLNTLISTDAAKASAVVLGLSDVLRYQLYEASGDKVLLKKDIEIVRQFLELEKIRRDNFQFGITASDNIAGIMIPPFIFINFVENAIKHSADNKGFSYISLDFTVADGYLNFNCKNSKPAMAVIKNAGGLGLQNIKRRLELMYANTFNLIINDEAKEFTINLKLPV